MNFRPPKTAWIFVVYVAVVLPLCFLGYGSDNDTYGVLESAQSTWHDGHLQTSRDPGYWLYEALVYGAGHFGGAVATNVGSMCAGAFVLWRFIVLCRKTGIRHELLLALCLLFVPTFLIAASSTIDYLWSLAFLIAAAELLYEDKLALASIVGAIAIGFRGSNSIVLAGAYAGLLCYGLITDWGPRQAVRPVISGLAAAFLGAFFYLPSWTLAHHTMSFLTPGIGPPDMWTLKMHVGRFLYKTIYLFGPFATGIFLFLLARRHRLSNFSSMDAHAKKGALIFSGAVAGNLLLFAKFPIEVSYLLPGAVFVLLAVGTIFLDLSRKGIMTVLCGIIAFNFISVSFARPNVPQQPPTPS